MKRRPSEILLFLLLALCAIQLASCTSESAAPASAPASTTLSWQVVDSQTGENLGGQNLVQIRADQAVNVTLTAEDPSGVTSIGISRNGFYKCRQGDEVEFRRSIEIGAQASGRGGQSEPFLTSELMIDPTRWRCSPDWELVGAFVDLEGFATNTSDQTANNQFYVVQ